MTAILDFPLDNSYIEHALEQEKESYTFDLWKTLYPQMMMGNLEFITFNDYKSKIYTKQQKYTQKTNEEIEQEFDAIISMQKGR